MNPRLGLTVSLLLILACSAHASKPQAVSSEEKSAAALSEISSNYKRQLQSEAESNITVACEPAVDRRDSDLCAQWKAADAADRSAWWASLAGIVSAIGLVGVAGALLLTIQSNRIARETAKRQLRAYVSFESGAISDVVAGSKVAFHFEFKNSGQTPCKILASAIGIGFEKTPISVIPALSPQPKSSPSSEGAGGRWSQSIETARPLTRKEIQSYQSGTHAFVGSCEIQYEDVFGEKHRTLVTAYRGTARALPPKQVSILDVGNDAT